MAAKAKLITRSIAVWLLIIATETVNGVVRELFIAPRVGAQIGRRVSFCIAIVLIALVALYFVRWIGAVTVTQLLGVGFIWAILTFLFEVLAGSLIAGREWDQLITDFVPSKGGLMAFGLVLMQIVPALAYRLILILRPEIG